jgi:hypothetical protein
MEKELQEAQLKGALRRVLLYAEDEFGPARDDLQRRTRRQQWLSILTAILGVVVSIASSFLNGEIRVLTPEALTIILGFIVVLLGSWFTLTIMRKQSAAATNVQKTVERAFILALDASPFAPKPRPQ